MTLLTFLSSLPHCGASMIPKFGNIFLSLFLFNLPNHFLKHSGIPWWIWASLSYCSLHRLFHHLFWQNVGHYNLLSWPRIGHKEQEKLLNALYWMPLWVCDLVTMVFPKGKEKANSSSQNSNIDNQDFIILILRHYTGH